VRARPHRRRTGRSQQCPRVQTPVAFCPLLAILLARLHRAIC
jgi:hypothetical protein